MTQASAAPGPQGRSYEIWLLVILTLVNGIVAFDRLTVAYVSPYIVKEMGLSNAQLGLMASALSLAIAISSFVGGRLADRTGRQKLILVICTLIFSVASGGAGLALNFAMLVGARFLLGSTEGPIVPITFTLMSQASPPARRGLNMGFMQMAGGFFLGGVLGPLLAIHLAEGIGWRLAVLLTAGPGLVLTAAMYFFLRPDPRRPSADRGQELPFLKAFVELLRVPNMRLCLIIAGLFTGWLMLQGTFLAVFLTEAKKLTPTTASWIISMGGFAGVIGGICLPMLSDRVGRKPVMIGATLAGTLGPAALLFLPSDPVLLGAAVLFGWMPLGIAPLYCAIVPTESVDPRLATTAVGFSMGMAELIGGVLMPSITGAMADKYSLDAVFWMCIGLAVMAAIAALFLTETAPRILGARRAPA